MELSSAESVILSAEKIKQKSRQIEAIFFIKLWFSDANVVLFYDI